MERRRRRNREKEKRGELTISGLVLATVEAALDVYQNQSTYIAINTDTHGDTHGEKGGRRERGRREEKTREGGEKTTTTRDTPKELK